MTHASIDRVMQGNGAASDDRRNGTVKANGVTLGVEYFGDAAAPLVLAPVASAAALAACSVCWAPSKSRSQW